jgi:hypothetical protein
MTEAHSSDLTRSVVHSGYDWPMAKANQTAINPSEIFIVGEE